MRSKPWLLWGATLFLALLPVRPAFSQTPVPGADAKAQVVAFWTEFFNQTPTQGSGEWLMLETPETFGDDPSGLGSEQLVAIDNGVEIGRVGFVEMPGGRIPVLSETRTSADGTPIVVTIETVVGTASNGGNSRALGGLLVTASKPGMTIRLVQLAVTAHDIRAVAPAMSRAAQRFQASELGSTGGTGPLPPVLEDPWICLPFGDQPDAQCGEAYCDGFIDLFQNSTLCLFSVIGTIVECGLATTTQAWVLCVMGFIGMSSDCSGTILDALSLERIRREAELCYCEHFPEYSGLCEGVSGRQISAFATDLLIGETVEATAECGRFGDPPIRTATARLDAASLAQKDILRCPDGLQYRVLSGKVATPGVAPENQRSCLSDRDRWLDVSSSNVAHLECPCSDPATCPANELYVTVSGLGANPNNLEVSFLASISTPLPTGNPGREFGSQGATRRDGELVLDRPAFSGATVRYANSPLLPSGCSVKQYLVPDLGQIPVTSSGNRRVKLAEIECGTSSCQNAQGCDVEARISLGGNGVNRIGGVRVALVLNGRPIQRTLDNSNDVLGVVPAGSTFSGLTILNPEAPIGEISTSLCDLAGPSTGVVGSADPSYISAVNCDRFKNVDQRPRPDPAPPAIPDEDCTTVCSTQEVPCVQLGFPQLVYCEETDCRNACFPVDPNSGPDLFRRPKVTFYVDSPTDDSATAGTIEVDHQVSFSGAAVDEEGVHGFAVYLDDDLVDYIHAGGHSSAVIPMMTLNTGPLAAGSHLLRVDVYDNHPQNAGASVAEIPFTVVREPQGCAADATAPTVSFYYPTEGGQLAPGNVTIGVDATDPSGVEWVQFYLDDEYRGTDSNFPYQHPWQASPGSHVLKAVALDGCGNYGEATVHVTVSDPCVGQPQPTVTITNLADGAWLEPERYTVAAQATAPAGQSIESVTFRVGDFSPFVDTTAPWTTGQYLLLTEGRVTIEAEALDSCGRIARQSIQVNISANASACEIDDGPPTASISAPRAGTVLSPGTVAVIGDVQDDLVLLAGALEVNGQVAPGDTVLSSNPDSYRWTWNATPGTHVLRLRVADVCWNTTISEPLTVTVGPGGSLADPNFWLLPAELRVLDGPVAPAGRPIDSLEEIEFGDIAGGRVGASRSFSLLNDGGQALTVSNITLTGTAFTLDPAPAVPFVVPGFRGEVTFRIKPTGLGAGPVTETLTIESDLGPFVVKLKALVDPNARVVFQSRFDADFEEGDLSEWMSVTGTAVSASPLAKRTGNFGLQIDHAAGTSAQFVSYTSAFDGLNSWRMKFALRTAELQLPEGGSMVVSAGVKVGGSIGWVVLRREGTNYSVRAIALLDGGGWAATPWALLTSKYSTVDVLWWRASDASVADGGIRLVTSDWTVVERTDLQNFQHRTERFRLGAGFGAPAGTTGVLHYDDVTIWY